jgi:beta-fructofuranosidase
MQVPDGRRLVWGWVNGFPGGHGWNGCLSLPRLLTLSHDGQLLQNPAPQLAGLRGRPVEWHKVPLGNSGKIFPMPKTNTMEISAEIDLQTAKSVEFVINGGAADAPPVVVSFTGSELQVMGAKTALRFSRGRRELRLHIFIDRSVLEVFANETVCATKVISPLGANSVLQIHAEGGTADARQIQAWPMKTIW